MAEWNWPVASFIAKKLQCIGHQYHLTKITITLMGSTTFKRYGEGPLYGYCAHYRGDKSIEV